MGDYIERKSASDAACAALTLIPPAARDALKAAIDKVPPADVRPVVRGRWVKIYEDGEPAVAQHQVGVCCSKCMKMPEDKFTESDFCPRCGADMKGEICGEE